MPITATTETELPQELLDRAMIRSRIAQLVSGEVELLDADDVVAELEREFGLENAL